MDGVGTLETDRGGVARDVQEPACVCATGGACEADGCLAREECAGQQRSDARDDGVNRGARTEAVKKRGFGVAGRHGRAADDAGVIDAAPLAAAQNIAMRLGRVMVISCPTPAIGIFLKDFHAPGNSTLRLGSRELPGEERET
jgi:hypothetical protein